jgi:hypothetical protein
VLLQVDRRRTQEEVLEELTSEGYDLSQRTLEYWRKEGHAPPLRRDGNERFYLDLDVEVIKFTCGKNGRAPDEILFQHTVEDAIFNIVRLEIFSVEGTINLILYEESGGFLSLELKESFDAFTRAYQEDNI